MHNSYLEPIIEDNMDDRAGPGCTDWSRLFGAFITSATARSMGCRLDSVVARQQDAVRRLSDRSLGVLMKVPIGKKSHIEVTSQLSAIARKLQKIRINKMTASEHPLFQLFSR